MGIARRNNQHKLLKGGREGREADEASFCVHGGEILRDDNDAWVSDDVIDDFLERTGDMSEDEFCDFLDSLPEEQEREVMDMVLDLIRRKLKAFDETVAKMDETIKEIKTIHNERMRFLEEVRIRNLPDAEEEAKNAEILSSALELLNSLPEPFNINVPFDDEDASVRDAPSNTEPNQPREDDYPLDDAFFASL